MFGAEKKRGVGRMKNGIFFRELQWMEKCLYIPIRDPG